MTFETETIDLEDGFDALFDHAWETWEENHKEYVSWIEEEYRRAVPKRDSTSGVDVAYDGDDAGQKAIEVATLKLFNLSETEASFVRNLTFGKQAIDQCVRSLNNWELADELSFWDHAKKSASAPEWYGVMCNEYRYACLQEITRRSHRINEQGGLEYIKTYNETHTISDILAEYGVSAVPGRTIHCPMHDDSTPSLKIFADNQRAYCFNQACALWNEGYGTDQFALNKILSR